MVELDCTLLDLPGNLAEQYAPQVRTALNQMTDVEAGKIVNIDEKRPVGHYWLRAPKLAPPAEGKAIVAAQEQVERFAAEARQRFGSYLLIGIGGSALGPQFVANAFREPGRTPPIFYFDNTDPEGFTRTLRDIAHAGGLGKTLAIVVSKSGGTPESRNGMLVAQRAYQDAK